MNLIIATIGLTIFGAAVLTPQFMPVWGVLFIIWCFAGYGLNRLR